MSTKELIERLPRRARIAFDARCARRVQPLFAAFLQDAPLWHVKAIDAAITLTEWSAVYTATDAAARHAAFAAAENVLIAVRYADFHNAYGAAKAAKAAYDACTGFGDTRAANAVVENASRAAAAVYDAFHAALQNDLERLAEAARRENWTDDTPVAPEFFGSMWPHGAPDGWPVERKNSDAAQILA